jgi:adenine/guanine phosphoribosyltransferase-like PRPP-binding protein
VTVQRVFERQRIWHMSQRAYRAGTELIAEAALADLGPVGTVIGIANGGRAPAYAIAARTCANVVIVRARHNPTAAVRTQASGQVVLEAGPLLLLAGRPGPFLIVDDICGSGATLNAVAGAVRALVGEDAAIGTATLCRNTGAPPGLPDLYVWEVADWVVFPWEASPGGTELSSLSAPNKVGRT